MPKKDMTPEERKAFGEKMKAARAAKKLEAKPTETQAAYSAHEPDDVEALKKQIAELKDAFISLASGAQGGAQVTARGLVGTVEKYTVDPKHYPDPRERLAKEPRLKRFAFSENWDLGWKVETIGYETKDGISIKEPKFTLELIGKVFDEDTGEPTEKRYVYRKLAMHEDPQAAITVARENGLEVDENNEKLFLDEMRYLRLRDWLINGLPFYAPLSTDKKNKSESVIGNRLVKVFEASSDNPINIPFDQL